MDINSLPISQLLLSCDLAFFLDLKSIIFFSQCSTCCSSVVYHHIEKELTFHVPLFSLHSTSPPKKFLNWYKNAKKIHNTFSYDITHASPNPLSTILPSTTTYYHGRYTEKVTSLPFLTSLRSEFNSRKTTDGLTFHWPPALKKASVSFHYANLSNLPPKLTYLCLCIDQLNIESLPPSLIILKTYTSNCVSNISISVLPLSLTHLILMNFNQPVDNNLPPNLIFLQFGENFNQTINYLPQNLKHLKLSRSFNQRLDQLPQHLTHLTLDCSGLTYSLDFLPSSLTHLKYIGADGVLPPQKLDNLPPHLMYLTLPEIITHPLDNLPPTLLVLKFSDGNSKECNISIDNLPPLRVLLLPKSFNCCTDFLPDSLKIFQCNSKCADNLLCGITHLTFYNSYNQPVDYLPPTISYLKFGDSFNQNVDHLPASVIYLRVGNDFDKSVDNLPQSLKSFDQIKWYPNPPSFNNYVDYLPNSLQKLHLGPFFNKSVDCLPASLNSIVFGANFNHPVDNLPPSITQIRFGAYFNKFVDNLPNSTTIIYFSRRFDKPVDHLPSSLTFLFICGCFNQPIDNLPISLTELYITGTSMFIQPFDHLPPFLKIFHFSPLFDDEILRNVQYYYLPQSIRSLLLPITEESLVKHSNLFPLLTSFYTS